MGALGRLGRYLRLPLTPGERAAADVDEEIRLHLDLRTEELMSEGLSPEEARREAERLFGDRDRARADLLRPARREAERAERRERLGDAGRDFRRAFRGLARSPAFTMVAALTLALGIGANTALFSLVDAVLLEPLPVTEPGRLAFIWEHLQREDGRGVERNVVNPSNFLDWDARSRSFTDMAAFWGNRGTLTGLGEPREAFFYLADVDFFRVLGARPQLGRDFAPEDGAGAPGSTGVAIISDDFWRTAFGGSPDVVGRSFELNGSTLEIIGVAPPEVGFLGPESAFWIPTDFAWAERGRQGRFISVIGRLAPGVSHAEAQREMQAVAAALRDEYPDFNAYWGANVVPLEEQVKGDVRAALLVLLGAVAVLLLIACANVANLMVVRSATRRREVAVRASLGATHGRIARELLTESLLLSLLGGALGLGLAWAMTQGLVAWVPEAVDVPRIEEVALDWRVLGFALALAVLTGALFGLAPMLDARRTELVTVLREGARGAGGGMPGRRFRSVLVVGEVALSLLLLVGAGLVLRSFGALQGTDLGLEPENVVTARIIMPGDRYPGNEARVDFVGQVLESLEGAPGVQAAGAVTFLPLAGNRSVDGSYPLDRPPPPPGGDLGTSVQTFQGDYFRAMGIPLLAGRLPTGREPFEGPVVAVVNRTLAERTWPGESAVGKRLALTWTDARTGEGPTEMEVIGVVGDVREQQVDTAAIPTVYFPASQFPAFGWASLAVRGGGESNALMREVSARIRQLDPRMAVADLQSMDDVVASAVARPRVTAMVMAAFAALALLLSAVGLYGVLAYTVSLRVRELGVRRALGAQSGDVLGLVLKDGLTLAVLGVGLGVVAAFAGTRVLRSLLYQVSPTDPLTFAATATFLLGVAALASWIPARRAARVDPTEAMREE